jgi:hypothetical protein
MGEPIVILNGKQVFETDSEEAAQIIEHTRDMLAALDAVRLSEEN